MVTLNKLCGNPKPSFTTDLVTRFYVSSSTVSIYIHTTTNTYYSDRKRKKGWKLFFFQFIFFRGFVRDFKLWDLMTLFYKAQNFTTDQLLSTYAKFLKRHCVSGNTKCLFFGKFFVRAKWEIPYQISNWLKNNYHKLNLAWLHLLLTTYFLS